MPMLLLIGFAGCDSNIDSTVAGDFTDQQPSGLIVTAVPPDSLTAGEVYMRDPESMSTVLAGSYEGIDAFSVDAFNVKFADLDSVVAVVLVYSLEDTWRTDGGVDFFEIYETHTDWSDTTRLDPDDFLPGLTTPVASVEDTSKFSFDIDPDIVRGWGDEGALLLTGGAGNGVIAGVETSDTNSPPLLRLISESVTGVKDTTTVVSNRTGRGMVTGLEGEQWVVSDGDGTGYILDIPVESILPRFAVVNRCLMTLTAEQSTMPQEPFLVSLFRLTEEYVPEAELQVDTLTGVHVEVLPGVPVVLDLTLIVNEWHIGGGVNHGLLVRSNTGDYTPNQCVFMPSDSLRITYTPLPEID